MVPLFGLPLGAWLVETGRFEFTRCGFKQMFELPCLSCGSTRATVHLLHGDLFTAISFQPLTLMVYAMLVVWGCLSLWGFLSRRSINFRLSKAEDVAFKVSLVVAPLMNWAYLIAAGI